MKWIANKILNLSQHYLNKAYERDGLTDEILDLQLRINYLRNKHNLKNKGVFEQ